MSSHTASAMIVMPATPATTPPAMAPVLLLLLVGPCDGAVDDDADADEVVDEDADVDCDAGFVDTILRLSKNTPFPALQQSPASFEPGVPQQKLPSAMQRVRR
jgi:hypothetical protein